MKKFIYLFIAAILIASLTSSIQKTNNSTKNIILQPAVKNVDPAALKKSADIITSRLKQFGLSSSEVTVSSGNGQLKVSLPESTDVSEIEGLVTLRGDIAFYETFTHSEIADLLKPDNKLFSLLNQQQEKTSSDPRVGCTVDENRKKTDEFLLSMSPLKNCKLRWGAESEKSGRCLFALKTDENGNPLLTRSDIQSVNIAKTADMKEIKIQIKLNTAGAKIFAEATKNNLHKNIAIVFDDLVNSWPVVQNVIEGGEIEVTGDFTEKEAKSFPVLFNSAQLPLSFKIVK
jgi:preprotein translocase subunit SecD